MWWASIRDLTTELEKAKSLARTISLILFQLAGKENTLSEALEKEQDDQVRNKLEDERQKVKVDTIETLRTIL